MADRLLGIDTVDYLPESLLVRAAFARDTLSRASVFPPEMYGAVGDGSTDDSAAIAAAYNAARAVKGTVLFANGRTYINASTINPAGTVTSGYGAVLKHKPAATVVSMFQVNDAGAKVLGLTIDLNKANTSDPGGTTTGLGLYVYGTTSFSDVVLRDVTVMNGHTVGVRFGTGASITDGKDAPDCKVLLENTRITGCDYGLYLDKVGGVQVRGGAVNGHALDGVWTRLTRDVVFSSVTVSGNGGHGIILSHAYGSRVSACICEGNGDSGIVMGGGDPSLAVNRRWTITGNVCRLNGDLGITVDPTITGSPATMQAQYGTISGNVCSGNTLHGIYLHNARFVAITGNTCEGNTLDGISSDSADCTFDGNTCVGNSQRGIAFNGNVTYPNTGNHRVGANVVSGNTSAQYYVESATYVTGLQFAAYTSTPPE